MFWSANYIVVRELNSLLKEENVTLTQVLEADDVLQECQADNKALIQFLTRPDILAELITLITEEPPRNVQLSLQYRHASIACEVLTSQLSTLSDRLSMDTVQMHRLCDFINREPPLNPLLASYFSKTIEMLLERSPKQDWYLYHIVCLRVLDFLKARRDFLPNLLRHLHTSAAVDALRCFVRLNDLFNKIVMEWLEEHQFLESLIQIICGTYEPPPVERGDAGAAGAGPPEPEREEKGLIDSQGKEVSSKESPEPPEPEASGGEGPSGEETQEQKARKQEAREQRAREQEAREKETREQEARQHKARQQEASEKARDRLRAVASANASALLCDILLTGCAGEGCQTRGRTAAALAAQARSPRGVGALLQGVFTAPPRARRAAIEHGAAALLALRRAPANEAGEECERSGVELCVAPHLPLLHTALLQPPAPHELYPFAATDPSLCSPAPPDPEAAARATVVVEGAEHEPAPARAPGEPASALRAPVGAARLVLAQLLAALAGSSVHEVATTMITLGTPGVLLDLFFLHPDNNFLHAHVHALVRNALANPAYRTQYQRHILEECDLMNRLIDVYEENENKKPGAVRSGFMGHVMLLLLALAPGERADTPPPPRWPALAPRLLHAALRHNTPLGGQYPSASSYETEGMVEAESAAYNNLSLSLFVSDVSLLSHGLTAGAGPQYADAGYEAAAYETTTYETVDYDAEEGEADRSKFLKLANQRMIEQLAGSWADDEAGAGAGDWDDGHLQFADDAAPATGVVDAVSPWDAATTAASPGEGWAQFSADGAPADPFAAEPFASDAFASDAFASDAFASDAFANDAFAKDSLASAAFAKDAFAGRESFGGRDAPRDDADDFTPFWGYQDKHADTSAESSAEAGMRALRLDPAPDADSAELDGPLDAALDALASPLADNLRTAMSSMAPEVIANIVNANMSEPLALASDPNATSDPSVTNDPNATSDPNVTSDPSAPEASSVSASPPGVRDNEAAS